MRRLVCRSAPLPTKHLARQMRRDENRHLHERSAFEGVEFYRGCQRRVVASPEDTDNGQCWSEEIFSTLNP